MDLSHQGTVSVVSYTHFGYENDLKSDVTYHAARGLAQQGLLNKLYVLDLADSRDIDSDRFEIPLPGGKLGPRGLYLVEKVLPDRVQQNLPREYRASRLIANAMDMFAANLIGEEDVLYSHPLFKRTIRQAKAQEVIVTMHGSTANPVYNRRMYEEEVIRLGLGSPPEGYGPYLEAIRTADFILCLSDFSKQTYINQGFDYNRILKIGPLGVDLEKFRPSSTDAEQFTVLCVADATILKGIHYLVEAWNGLDLPDSRLVLAGRIPPEISDIILERVTSDDTIYQPGHVDNIEEWYRQASVLVHPSLSEGCSKVILEALASGLPVVGTTNTLPELIREAGFVVPIRDPDAIADRVRYLYDNPDERAALGNCAREVAKQNTWDEFSRRVREVHEEIIAQGED